MLTNSLFQTRSALEVLKKKPADGYGNILVALMLLENVKSKKELKNLPFDDVEEDDLDGVEWTEVVTFVQGSEMPI